MPQLSETASDVSEGTPSLSIWAYSKGLRHDSDGQSLLEDLQQLQKVVQAHDLEALQKVRLAGPRRLLGVSAGWEYTDLPQVQMAFQSPKMVSFMVELYFMALARDIPFRDYASSTLLKDLCRSLNTLTVHPQYRGEITSANIFRGPFGADQQGLYISQYLYQEVHGVPQKYYSTLESYEFLTTWHEALEIQNGSIPTHSALYREYPRYLLTGRDLACAHRKDPFQPFLNALHILEAQKVPLNFPESAVEEFYTSLGPVDIETTLRRIGHQALQAAWHMKWQNLVARPEVFGMLIERAQYSKRNPWAIPETLLTQPILEACRHRFGTYLLPQVYPEGSPMCPSIPAEDAVVAGACATVLKFFFDLRGEMAVYQPNAEGSGLTRSAGWSTYAQELEKLVSNVAWAKSWAGCQYWIDNILGIKLGEKMALAALQEQINAYPQTLCVTVRKFTGKSVTLQSAKASA